MAKAKTKKRVKKKSADNRTNYWFRIRKGSNDKWGFLPINWKGSVALFSLIVLNIVSANYFFDMNFSMNDLLKMLTVFFLSMLVFILIAKQKTRRE